MARRITASKLDLAFECLHWTQLDYDEPPPGRAAVKGTAFHSLAAFGEHHEQLSDEEQEYVTKQHAGWLKNGAGLIPQDARFEVAYTLSPNGTIRELGENIGREYDAHGAGPHDICGSLDVESEAREVVQDWKTGKPRVAAVDSWQLRFAAVVSDKSRGEFHYVSPTGRAKVDAAEFGDNQMAADFEALTLLAQRHQAGNAPPVYGEHCDAMYCPARGVCAKYQQASGRAAQVAPVQITKKQAQTQTHTERKPMATSILSRVTTGKRRAPYFVVLYGPEGIGKSTFAADAPSPIFLSEPGGSDELDIARMPDIATMEDVDAALDELANEAHDYKTLVVDTADYVEPLIFEQVCRLAKKSNIEDFGYGKGYVLALDRWRELIAKFNVLRTTRGMHVIVLAHSQLKTLHNPTGDDYERYTMKLAKGSAPLLKESAMAVLFTDFVSYTERDANTKRVKAFGDGSRIIYTEHRPAFDAKNRYGLPFEIPLSWDDFHAAAVKGEPDSVVTLLDEVNTLIAAIPIKSQPAANEYREKIKDDAKRLAIFADKLRGKIREQNAA